MFTVTKLLSFLPMGNMLRGTSGKIILIIGALVGLAFLVWQWKDAIRETVFNEIYAEQAQAALEDQQRRQEIIQDISEKNRELERELERTTRELTRKADEIEKSIKGSSDKDDGEVAPVLRNTLNAISNSGEESFDAPDDVELETNNPWIREWKRREQDD